MHAHNGTGQEHRVLEERLDAFKEEVSKLIDRVTEGSADKSSRVKAFAGKASEAIKAHPMVAVALAFGLGYLVVRAVRR